MDIRMNLRAAILSAAVVLSISAAPAETWYLAGPAIDAASFIGPPPEPGSLGQIIDKAEVLSWQGRKTDPRWTEAVADVDLSIFNAFDAVLGDAFTAANAPRTAALMTRLMTETRDITGAAKTAFDRRRPYETDPGVVPCAPVAAGTPLSGSYPSGHAMVGWLAALVLADMAPEKADALLERGRRYGDSRVVCGVHYPSDVTAGRLMAAAVFARARANPDFQHDLAAARHEVRRLLGYAEAGWFDRRPAQRR
jgi:acid phosphatase (class A)